MERHIEAVLRVSSNRKSAYIEKSRGFVKLVWRSDAVAAASVQNRHRVIIPPP